MFAMVTKQGTAAKETAVCVDCTIEKIFEGGCLPPVPDDVEDEQLVNCTGNDELECIFCGAKE